jgi:UDP-2,3-diacylglucosamine pyrophosphatase LpxH
MVDASGGRAGLGRLRTVFLSDIHLGYRGCQADFLLDFLERLDTEQLVLVGDIIDLWSMRRRPYWPDAHQAVIRKIMAIAASGTRVVYVPGNHDDPFRDFCGHEFAGITVCRDFIHETAAGERYLVLHGDDFDGAVQFSGFLKVLGERIYDALMWLGRGVQHVRRALGFGHWSLAAWLKHQVPDARRYIERFEHAAAHAALRHGLDGVICGHIHRPEIRVVDGIRYCNDGDWVEHCSALIENARGDLSIVVWTDRPAVVKSTPAARGPIDRVEPELESAA